MQVNSRVLIMREAITKIVPMLTQRSVKVTQQGTQAFVSYNRKTLAIERVNLPYIPEDASNELLDATQGFLDHEVGHILFTEQSIVLKAEKLKVHTLHNMIEDTFVERRMGEQFPGCGANLTRMHGFFLAEYIDTQLKEKPEHSAAILMVVAIRAWAGQPAFIDYMADKWGLMKEVVDRLGKDFPKMLRNVQSSADGLKVALEAKKRLEPKPVPKAPPPPPAPPPPAPPSPPEEPSEEPQPGAGSPGEPGDEEDPGQPGDMPPLPGDEPPEGEEIQEPVLPPEDATAEEPAQEPAEEPGAEPAQSEEPTAEAPAGEPADEGDEDEGDSDPGAMSGAAGGESTEDDEEEQGDGAGDGMAGGDASGDTSESDDGDAGGEDENGSRSAPTSGAEKSVPGGTPEEGASDSSGTIGESDPERDLFKEIAEAPIKDFDEAASDALSKEAREATRNAAYSVFTRDEDNLEVLEVPAEFDQATVVEMQKQVDHMIGPLQKDLQRAIAARSASIWTGGHRRGQLHGASLARVLTGRDDVFRQKQVSRTKDVAVELVVDASGSMWRRGKIVVAAYAAYALSAVLDNIGIANEVVAFSTKDFSSKTARAMREEAVEHGLNYSRTAALDIRILKAFNERMTPATRRRFAMLSTGGEMMEENVDGESVQLANHRLQQQRSARKVMMVLSDGMPACGGGLSPILNEHLKSVVKQIEARGTDVVALGILDESVKKFYRRAIVLNSVEDLPRVVMHELHKLLVH